MSDIEQFRVLDLTSLVRMKLLAFRRRDQVHLLDMLDLGLIDASWPARYEPILAARLQGLIDNPEYRDGSASFPAEGLF